MNILSIVGIIFLVILLVVLSGYLLPEKHTAIVSIAITAPVEEVWSLISNPATYTDWRTDIVRVEVAKEGRLWTEFDKHGDSLTYAMVREEENKLLETHIEDKDKPFGGGWVITLDQVADTTTVTVTENGEVYNPVYRIISRFVIGHNATAEKYLAGLKTAVEK